ncbi:MAG: glycosyltransferase family 2 protein [Chloroflexota bacterium]
MHAGCPKVFCIILNYRNADLTEGAVRSLKASEFPGDGLRIFVVDNGSGDGSAERLRERCPDVTVIASRKNLGFAGGNNIGLRKVLDESSACPDPENTFVLLLNNDVEVEPDALAIAAERMQAETDIGVVGPKVLLPDGRLDLACRRSFPTPSAAFWKLTGLARRYPTHPRYGRYNLTYLDEDTRADVDAVMGAFMLLRLSVVRRVGLLDDAFFMYGEDLDWAYRIKAHGWRVVYEPAATVWHLKGATSQRSSNKMIVEFYRAMWLFYRKHYAERSPFLLDWLVILGIIARGTLALGMNVLRPAGSKRVS